MPFRRWPRRRIPRTSGWNTANQQWGESVSENGANKVSLVACETYEYDRVLAAVRRSVDLLGGMGRYVHPGERVLLKPNLVRAFAPERAATTHPMVVAAVARLVHEAGGQPSILDSPGGPYTPGLLRLAYRRTGMTQAAELGDAELITDTSTIEVSHPEGVILRRLDLVAPLAEADVVINIPKLKTHNLTTLTLTVKNLFGLVPGAIKIGYHGKLRDKRTFCQGLVDIQTYVRTDLNVVDAIVGMEGNGPSGGDPRQVGTIVAGVDDYAVDTVCASLVGFDPLSVETTRVAVDRGLTSGRIEDIDLIGDSLEALRVEGFRAGAAAAVDPGLLPRQLVDLVTQSEGDVGDGKRRGIASSAIVGWLGRQLVPLPVAGDKCTGCGYCARHCPADAIAVVAGRARMDPRVCIRCYCCHELCPELAVELRYPWLGRVLMSASGRK